MPNLTKEGKLNESQKQEIKEKIQEAIQNLKEDSDAWDILSYVYRELSFAMNDEWKRLCLNEIKIVTGKGIRG